jgi:hypothetical protein
MNYVRINRVTPVDTYPTVIGTQPVTIRVFTPSGPRSSRKVVRRKPR